MSVSLNTRGMLVVWVKGNDVTIQEGMKNNQLSERLCAIDNYTCVKTMGKEIDGKVHNNYITIFNKKLSGSTGGIYIGDLYLRGVEFVGMDWVPLLIAGNKIVLKNVKGLSLTNPDVKKKHNDDLMSIKRKYDTTKTSRHNMIMGALMLVILLCISTIIAVVMK